MKLKQLFIHFGIGLVAGLIIAFTGMSLSFGVLAGGTATTTDTQVENPQNEPEEPESSRVARQYDELISAAERQGEEIQVQLNNCGDGCDQVLELRAQANAQYVQYLRAKKQLEMAKVDPETEDNQELIDEYAGVANNFSNDVKNILSQITELERTAEIGRTYDVSDIFSLNNNSPENEIQPRSFLSVTNQIANWLITLVASLAVTTLIVGGFLMIISGGDEGRLETGKTIFTYSLIGITVTLMAYGIVAFIQSIFY